MVNVGDGEAVVPSLFFSVVASIELEVVVANVDIVGTGIFFVV